MLALIGDNLVEDGDAGFISKTGELLAVVGDVAAFVDFEAAKSKSCATDAVGEVVGLAGGVACVGGFWAS